MADNISCGGYHTIVTDQTDSNFGSGNNKYGQLGITDTIDRNVLSKINIKENISELYEDSSTHVVCGGNFSFITTKNKIMSAGNCRDGQLSHGYVRPIDELKEITFIEQSEHDYIVNITEPIKQVECGAYHTVLLLENGRLKVFGDNSYGQLGLGDNVNRNEITDVNGIENVKEISCGDYYTAILLNTGEVYMCGKNDKHQLLQSNAEPSNIFIKVDNVKIL